MKSLLALALALSATTLVAETLDDTAITGRIETELLAGEGIWLSDIVHVATVEGVVHLSGTVAAEKNRLRAGAIARSVAGVKQVDNDLRVR